MKTTAMNLVAAACLVAGPASAAMPPTATAPAGEAGSSVVVRYSELDVTGERGADVLIGRINQAARKVCGPKPALYALAPFRLYRECVAESAAAAIGRLNQPLVSAIYEQGRNPMAFAGG